MMPRWSMTACICYMYGDLPNIIIIIIIYMTVVLQLHGHMQVWACRITVYVRVPSLTDDLTV